MVKFWTQPDRGWDSVFFLEIRDRNMRGCFEKGDLGIRVEKKGWSLEAGN